MVCSRWRREWRDKKRGGRGTNTPYMCIYVTIWETCAYQSNDCRSGSGAGDDIQMVRQVELPQTDRESCISTAGQQRKHIKVWQMCSRTSLVLQISPSVEPQALPGVAFHGIIPVSTYKVNHKFIKINVIIDSVIFLFMKLFWNSLYWIKCYRTKADLTSFRHILSFWSRTVLTHVHADALDGGEVGHRWAHGSAGRPHVVEKEHGHRRETENPKPGDSQDVRQKHKLRKRRLTSF